MSYNPYDQEVTTRSFFSGTPQVGGGGGAFPGGGEFFGGGAPGAGFFGGGGVPQGGGFFGGGGGGGGGAPGGGFFGGGQALGGAQGLPQVGGGGFPFGGAGGAASSAASGINFEQIKGIVDRMGGIDGILSTMTKVQKIVGNVQQMAPLFKLFMKSGAKTKTTGTNDDKLAKDYAPRRRRSRKKTRTGSTAGRKRRTTR